MSLSRGIKWGLTMSYGIKRQIDRLFEDKRLVTVLTIVKKTVINYNFGYEPVTETEENRFEINAVPANYVQTSLGFFPFGNLQEGDSRFFCSADADIDDTDEVILNGDTFSVRSINAYWVGDEKVAQILVISTKPERVSSS
jgi:hypothetical protein